MIRGLKMWRCEEIGSDFELPLEMSFGERKVDLLTSFDLKDGCYVFLRGGRAALKYLLEAELKVDPNKPFL